jgi:hypothetical protein
MFEDEDMSSFKAKAEAYGDQREQTGVWKGLLLAGMIACLTVIVVLFPDVFDQLFNHYN